MGNSNGIMNESPIPLYYQIYVDLKNKLLINKLVDENGKLPAEKELAESYKVSRVTMRQAIAELEKDGLVSVRDTYEFFASASSADRQMKIYGNLFHEIFNEYCRDEVIGNVIGWIINRI